MAVRWLATSDSDTFSTPIITYVTASYSRYYDSFNYTYATQCS